MYIHNKDLYVKDVFPERYMREPLKTGNILMIVDNQLKHDVFDYSVKGSYLDEIRKTYFDVISITQRNVCPGATICDENTNPLGNRVYQIRMDR